MSSRCGLNAYRHRESDFAGVVEMVSMTKDELCTSLVELGKKLNTLHEMDWFHHLGSTVDYSKKENVDMVRAKVDHVIGGVSVLYLIAVFESYFPQQEWGKYVSPDKLKILRAYRYIRHCIAHASHGKRIPPKTKTNKIEYQAFDDSIKNELFSPKNIIELNKSTNQITIKPTIGIYLRQFMLDIVQQVVSQVC